MAVNPYASHYLKIVLDAVFGVRNFRNEIVWHYHMGNPPKKDFRRQHDILFRYSVSEEYQGVDLTVPRRMDEKRFNKVDNEGRRYHENGFGKRFYADEGKTPDDVWTYCENPKFTQLNSMAKQRTSYPTQKPIELYKRIIESSSKEDDVVLDPFAGCGTPVLAAEELGRQWIGIDLTYLAIGAVKLQIEKFCPQIRDEIIVIGTPEDANQALDLARTAPNDFEAWCVSHVLKFQSNAKKVADGGIDGRMKFPKSHVRGSMNIPLIKNPIQVCNTIKSKTIFVVSCPNYHHGKKLFCKKNAGIFPRINPSKSVKMKLTHPKTTYCVQFLVLAHFSERIATWVKRCNIFQKIREKFHLFS